MKIDLNLDVLICDIKLAAQDYNSCFVLGDYQDIKRSLAYLQGMIYVIEDIGFDVGTELDGQQIKVFIVNGERIEVYDDN